MLLGVNQALTWSMTVNMMVDVAPTERRGFAAGINEFCGYLGVSLLAYLTGLVAASYSLRPEPFYLGMAVSVLGLGLSLFVPETLATPSAAPLRWVRGVGLLSALGSATNFKDGLVWLSLPLLMGARGFSLAQVGAVAGLYPLVWATGQLVFGPLSDRLGRQAFIVCGTVIQGLGLIVLGLSGSFVLLVLAALLLGLGTGMVYPTLIARVADRVAGAERATALGTYRFFRDAGYALGALLAGLGAANLSALIVSVGVAMAFLGVWARKRV